MVRIFFYLKIIKCLLEGYKYVVEDFESINFVNFMLNK